MWIVWIVIAVTSVGLDQWTKAIAVSKLRGAGTQQFIPGLLQFTYVENTGAAFGMLKGQRWLFLTFSTLAIAAIIVFMIWKRKEIPVVPGIALAMIAGGGVGNQIDRFGNGYVVYFLEFGFVNFPVFNIADSFVTVGAVMLACFILFGDLGKTKKKKESGSSDGTGNNKS